MTNLITQLKQCKYWKKIHTAIITICFIPFFIIVLLAFLLYEYVIYEKSFNVLLKEYYFLFKHGFLILKEVLK